MADTPARAGARPAAGHRAADSPRERDTAPTVPPSSLPWLRPAMAAIVLALGLLTVVAMIAVCGAGTSSSAILAKVSRLRSSAPASWNAIVPPHRL